MGARDRLTVEAFVTAVLAMLEEPPENLQPSLPRWLALTLEQIRLYPNFAGGPAAMARLAHRSPEHVARECRRFLGRCPSDLVNAARLEYAAQELRTGQKPILDIALDCGIENLGHFYQLFRRHYAQTPARYRRKLQIPSTRPG
jgi:AraC family cel operon transcriptional repressor